MQVWAKEEEVDVVKPEKEGFWKKLFKREKPVLLPELKSCPFCGGEAEEYATQDTEYVACIECWATSDVAEVGSGGAAKAWNTRVEDEF